MAISIQRGESHICSKGSAAVSSYVLVVVGAAADVARVVVAVVVCMGRSLRGFP